jgi:hypothetical protein
MQVFVSHATEDHPLAVYLKGVFSEVGVTAFMLPDDAPAGASWMDTIRQGLADCDEAVYLLTPRSLGRQWIAAEWAAFWAQGKAGAPLRLGVPLEHVWEPMRMQQGAALDDHSGMARLLKRWAETTGKVPAEGVLPLAREIAAESVDIAQRLGEEALDKMLERFSRNIRHATSNVSEVDVANLVAAGRISDVVAVATADEAAPVKQKQVAASLLSSGRHADALRVAISIDSRAEAKNVALLVVNGMDSATSPDSGEWAFLEGIYGHLRDPQRRDVRERMQRRGVVPQGSWAKPAD